MFLSLARTRPSTPVFGSFSDNHIPRKHVSECTSDPAVQFSKSSSKIYSNLVGKSQPNCRVQNSFEPGKSTTRCFWASSSFNFGPSVPFMTLLRRRFYFLGAIGRNYKRSGAPPRAYNSTPRNQREE